MLGQSLACQGDPDDGPGVYDPISDLPQPRTALPDAGGIIGPDDMGHEMMPPNAVGGVPPSPTNPGAGPATGTLGGAAVGGGVTGGGATPGGGISGLGGLPGAGAMDAGVATPASDAGTTPAADANAAADADAGVQADAQRTPDAH